MSLSIDFCTNPAEWDAYVHASPLASNYHLWRWKQVIEDTYGHSTHYLVATESGRIQGVLPLVGMKSWFFGHFLVSLPFFNYGGMLAETQEARIGLLAKAVELAKDAGAQHIELRQGAPSELSWQEVSAKVAMVVHLPEKAEELWGKLSSRLRNKIRNSRKHGFEVSWGGSEQVSRLYSVFAANMRNLGTPVYPRAWFENVCRACREDVRILTLSQGGRAVAATLAIKFRDFLELPWIASLPDERKQYSTVLLYWIALEWGIQNGFRRVDLGRCTPGGGVYQFKRQWGCEEIALHWYYWLAPGMQVPHLRPDNPRYRLAVRLWQKLPLGVANWLGPRIVRSIP